MIQFINVSKRYSHGREALQNVSFEIQTGEMAFLTGHSGAGKSTVLKLIAAMERTTRGQVLVNRTSVSRLRKGKIPYYRRHLGVIFQDHKLLFDRTVFDNVALPLVIAGHRRKEIERRVRGALDKVNLLHKERSYPIALSGGEQQRVGIARAISARPPVLLADEPTGNLDPQLSREIMTLFDDFKQVGVTVLVASHDLDLIRELGHRTLVLADGKLIDDGLLTASR